MTIITVGIDLAKNVFSVHGVDENGKVAQRRTTRSLAQWLSACASRDEALFRAHKECALTMSAIARELRLSVSRVSRLIARAEGARGKT
ncbi:MAG: hypothetical protein ACREVZ_07600 [Burkholderiales bacterium]